jgi:hypothetical protein
MYLLCYGAVQFSGILQYTGATGSLERGWNRLPVTATRQPPPGFCAKPLSLLLCRISCYPAVVLRLVGCAGVVCCGWQ